MGSQRTLNGISRSLYFSLQQLEAISSFWAGERCVFACYPKGAKNLPEGCEVAGAGFIVLTVTRRHVYFPHSAMTLGLQYFASASTRFPLRGQNPTRTNQKGARRTNGCRAGCTEGSRAHKQHLIIHLTPYFSHQYFMSLGNSSLIFW